MKLVFKVILLFLIIFNFPLSYTYNSVFLSMFLATAYYFFDRKAIPFTYFMYRHNVIIFLSTMVLALVTFSYTTLHEVYSMGIIRRLGVQFYMLCALIYILPILLEGVKKSEAHEYAMMLICYIFALQGLIHLCGYLIPEFGDYLVSIKAEGFKNYLEDPTKGIDRFRGYALSGTVFFELPSAYGVAFIVFIRLQLIAGQRYISGYKSYFILGLILMGIMLTGRVGFVGVGVGIGLYFLFVKNPVAVIGRIAKRLVVFLPFLIVSWLFLLSPVQRQNFQNELFPFAFEFWYNFQNTGHFSTGSTNVTFKAFYYPLRDETLLWGHGIDSVFAFLKLYSFTDAGYMRQLIFGGVFYLIALVVYQFLYFFMPIKTAAKAWKEDNRVDVCFFFLLFIYILVLNIKDLALGVQHLTEVLFLFIGFSYLLKYYAKQEE